MLQEKDPIMSFLSEENNPIQSLQTTEDPKIIECFLTTPGDRDGNQDVKPAGEHTDIADHPHYD